MNCRACVCVFVCLPNIQYDAGENSDGKVCVQ
jgi:hypothetical protein